MRVFPVYSHLAPGSWSAEHLPPYFDRVARGDLGPHELVSDAERADAFLFLSSDEPFRSAFYRSIREHPLMKKYPERCFVWNVNDLPFPLLPGLYAALPKHHASRRCEAYCYLVVPNPALDEVRDAALGREPDLLFSFVGAANTILRRRVLALRDTPATLLEDTNAKAAWFTARESDARYADTLARSRFVLCPAGHGTSSYRIFEAMQMGRVPVIVADAWLEPPGPAWSACSVRVRERDVAKLPAILGAVHDPAGMGALARVAWETWFAPNVQLRRVAEGIGRIIARTPPESRGLLRMWPAFAALYRAEQRARIVDRQVRSVVAKARGKPIFA